MPDVFDEVTGTGKEDIFDQITSPTPATDRAAAATPAPPPPPMSTLQGAGVLLNRLAAPFRSAPTAPAASFDTQLIPAELPDHSQQWNQEQARIRQEAAAAGLPDTPSGRDRLISAIARSEAAGYPVPHQIGLPGEPTGDAGPTKDVQNLVNTLKQREQRDPSVAKERAYWENELADLTDPFRATGPTWATPVENFMVQPLPMAKEAAMAAVEHSYLAAVPNIIQTLAPESTAGRLIGAAKETTAENLAGFMSPANLILAGASMGLAEVPAGVALNRLVAAGFGISQAKHTYQLYKEFAQEPDPEKKTRLGMALAESGVLTALLGKGALEGGIGRARGAEPPPLSESGRQIVDALAEHEKLLREPGITRGDPRLAAAEAKIKSVQDQWLASLEGEQAKEAQAPPPAAPAEGLSAQEADRIRGLQQRLANNEITQQQYEAEAGAVLGRAQPVGPTGPQIRVSSQTTPVESAFAEQRVPINWQAVRTAREEGQGLAALQEASAGLISWEDTKPLLEEFQKVRRKVPGINDQQAAELAMLKLNVEKATKGTKGTAKAVLDDAVERIGGEIRRATQERQQQISGQPEYQGVPQGENLPAYPAEVRETGRGQAGGGGGVEPSPPVAPPEEPVISREQYKELRHRRAAGEIVSPEEHQQMARYEQAGAQGLLGPKVLKDVTTEAAKASLETGVEGQEAAARVLREVPRIVAGAPTGFVPGAADVHLGAPGGVRSPETEAANAAALAEIAALEKEHLARQRAEEAALEAELLGRKRAKGPTAPQPATAVTEAPARPPPTPEELRYGPREPAQPGQPPPLPPQPPPLPEPAFTGEFGAGKWDARAAERAAAADVGPQVWANMKQERLKNPNASLRVSQSLAKNHRAANPTEWAHLNQRLIDLEKEQTGAIADRNANPNDVLARDRVDQLNQDIIDQRDLMARSRSAVGQSATAVEILDQNRMTPARMRAEAQALANDGRPLSTNPELEKFTNETAKGLEEVNKNIAETQAHQMFEQVLKESRTEARVTEARLEPKKPFLQDAYDKAQARMQERFKQGEQFFSGIVPDPALIRDQAIIGAYHIGRGLTKFADWSKAVAKDIGQKSADYMQELFARSKQYHVEASKALNQPSKLTPAEIKEMTALTRTEKQIGQLQKGQAPAGRAGPRAAPLDPFLRKQLAKKAQLQSQWNARLAKERWKQLPLARRAAVRSLGVGQEIQTLKSAYDVSFALRQGGVLGAAHPILASKAFGEAIKTGGGRALAEGAKAIGAGDLAGLREAARLGKQGELAAHETMTDIYNHPLNVEDNVIKRSGLELTDPFAEEYGALNNTKVEEAFKGVLAKKLPGVEWSNRTFHVFLNKLRAESLYALVNQLEKITGRKATDGELKVIGNYINIASGRGATGGFIKSFEGMSKIFWSPRLFMSRLQLLSGQPLWRGITHNASPVARALIAKEYGASLSGLALALSLGGMIGAKIILDRRSKDFGKLQFGNTHIDLMAGLQQPFVLGSQIIAGEQKTSKGKVIPIRGRIPYGQPSAWDLMGRFGRAKLTPGLGIGVNVATGSTITGQPTSPLNEALTAFLPLSPGDVVDAMQSDGVSTTQGAGASVLALLGAGVGTYRPVTGAEKEDYRQTLERRDKALLHGDIPKAAHLTRKLWKGPY
jgi:hypothetical protein